MSSSEARFTSQNKTTQQRISNNTVGLVALSDFRKRRAEVLEQQEREAREAVVAAANTSTSTPDRSRAATPEVASDSSLPPRKKKKGKAAKPGATKLSFGGHDEDDEGDQGSTDAATDSGDGGPRSKFKANSALSVVPRAVTKSALRREAAEREALRRQFLLDQEALKSSEVAVPFVFYDGHNVPGGMARVKKGDHMWVFLDRARKLGANLSAKATSRKQWARVSVDDLIMIRGNVIIPHHYDFLFFVMNKTVGPTGQLLFDYTDEAPKAREPGTAGKDRDDPSTADPLPAKTQPEVASLEGASDDPTLTKVVDRRWYERNKHIYPASVWQDFDPEREYHTEVKRDPGGNAFFYS
ncbi:XAP5-domain-containing protein [Xylariaceae sp. FL0804]|nr:XAP5-domain-containing protein [Xylariaceae sp. FL0804]